MVLCELDRRPMLHVVYSWERRQPASQPAPKYPHHEAFAKQKNHRSIAATFRQPVGWLLRLDHVVEEAKGRTRQLPERAAPEKPRGEARRGENIILLGS